MFKHIRATLGWVTAEATLVLREHRISAPDVSGAFMRRVAVHATQSAFGHRMMTRQIILSTDVRMTLVADGLFGSSWFDCHTRAVAGRLWPPCSKTVRRFDLAARIGMQAARAMAGFAAGI